MTSDKPAAPVPWYRVSTVWLVIAIPLSAVIAGVAILSFSIITNDGLVVDDYYRRGKEINRTLARDRTAITLGIKADVNLLVEDRRVRARLAANDLHRLPEIVHLLFLHPTQIGKDRTVVLTRGATGEYFGTLPALSRARWIVQLGTAQWRLNGSVSWPAQPNFSLQPDDRSS
ncbi:MAG: FixH family protein [Gammaproteobacteria bacterium]|nr:FixH family protein [Gammaproteobacteria bacterium]